MRNLYILIFSLLTITGFSQTPSDFIVVDQFGYRPSAKKIAVIRDPQIGHDANLSFTPGSQYALVNAIDNQQVFKATPTQWNAGSVDSISGDKVWWFDFSAYTNTGTYYVLDIQNNVKSYTFDIQEDVYNSVLKHACRTFFYQRAGFAKKQPFAEVGWEDNASHIGPLQDKNCRIFSDPTNATTEKDLHGGWYDAGDYNKYTSWTGNYIIELLKSFEESPSSWTDDYNIPESNNGIPDVLDEAKWGMDYLLRLQNPDGSVISIVSLDHASPPSSAKGKSVYGNVNTSATLKAAAAYAFGAKIFRQIGLPCYADSLTLAAEKAWNWAANNPSVVWANNSSQYNSIGVGAGNMEIDDYGRLMYKLEAAVYLFALTGNNIYKTFFDNHYTQSHLIQWSYAYPFEHANQEALLYYTTLKNTSESVVNDIKSSYENGIKGGNSFQAYYTQKDAYQSHIEAYVWGSNGTKCNQGLMFYEADKYHININSKTDANDAAENFIHYMHGVNPVNKVYLSNMNPKGAENAVACLYHSWFTHGSVKWDKVGSSTYGPAPGFVVGGANPTYKIDNCCPNNCGSSQNNALCSAIDLSKILNQPKSKSYLDFNNSWPINSWEITENSGGTQVAYIRLLAKFIKNNGASISGLTTCTPTNINNEYRKKTVSIFPNPSQNSFTIHCPNTFKATIINTSGETVLQFTGNGKTTFGNELSHGEYIVKIETELGITVEKIIKK